MTYKSFLPILIGSTNDLPFLKEGLDYLGVSGIPHEVIILSVHRNPYETPRRVRRLLKRKGVHVIIAGAATATGLPGFVAGCAIGRAVFGVRFSKEPGPNILEDATFNLSSMPKGVPLVYMGYNEKGFFHACLVAKSIIDAIELEGKFENTIL